MFPQMTSSILPTPKGHLLVRKYVVWGIKRENRSNGSTWARAQEKRTGQDSQKVAKASYFTYLERSSHRIDLHRNLYSSCRARRNHKCEVLNWNFQGLRFFRRSNFRFSYWFLRGPYKSAADVRYKAPIDVSDSKTLRGWYPRTPYTSAPDVRTSTP